MPDITLLADTGRTTGSGAAGRLRAAGKIPAVVYGHGMTPVSIAVDRRALRGALTGPAGLNALITLQVGDTQHATVVKELQRHPVRRNVTHVDFLVVSLTEAITIEVPLVLTGEATRVQREGGVVEHGLVTLTVVTTPQDIPDEITIDVSNLQVGDIIRVGDLTLPRGSSTPLDPETPVVTAAHGADIAAEDAAAAAEGDEGEGAEGGAATAAGEGEANDAASE
jgi:large subunit ribosomal protein L25